MHFSACLVVSFLAIRHGGKLSKQVILDFKLCTYHFCGKGGRVVRLNEEFDSNPSGEVFFVGSAGMGACSKRVWISSSGLSWIDPGIDD